MVYCTKCGNPVPDNARFCSKCGAPVGESQQPDATEDAAVQPQPRQQQVVAEPRKPKKPIDFGKFNKHFWPLYIIIGVCSYVLVDLAAAYTGISSGLAITLGVLAIIAALAFCTIGVVRFVAFLKESEENRNKYAVCNVVCMALGIIMLVFVVMMSAVVFKTVSDMSDLTELLSSMFGG